MQFLDNLDSFEGGADPAPSSSTGASSKNGAGARGGAGAGAASTTAGAKGTGSASNGKAGDTTNPEDAQSVLDFLDEIVTSRDRPRATTTTSTLSANSGGTGASAGGLRGSTADALKRPPSSSPGISRSGSRSALRDDGASGIAGRKSTDSARSLKSSYLTPATGTAAHAAEKLQDMSAPSSVGPPATSPTQAASSGNTGGGGWGWGSVWSQASNVIQQARTVAEEVRTGSMQHHNCSVSLSSVQCVMCFRL